MNAAQFRLAVAMTLMAITLAVFALVEPYRIKQPQLLANGDFSTGFDGWRAAGVRDAKLQLEQGKLVIRAEQDGTSPGVRQEIQRDPGDIFLRLSAEVRRSGVASGLRPWHAMRLLLVQKDRTGKPIWELPHIVEQGRGDKPWHHVSRVFRLPPQIQSVEVVAVLNQVAGQMQVRGLTLAVLVERTLFRNLKSGLVIAWISLLPWLGWPLLRHGRWPSLALALLILIGSLTPHTAKNHLRNALQDVFESEPAIVNKTVPTKPEATTPAAVSSRDTVPLSELWRGAHKLGHVLLFCLLGGAICMYWRRQRWYRQALYLGAFAVTVETLQLLSLDRSAHPYDAGLNLLGGAIGLVIGGYFANRHPHTTAPDPPTP